MTAPKGKEKSSVKEIIDHLLENYGIIIRKEEEDVAIQEKKQTSKDHRTLH